MPVLKDFRLTKVVALPTFEGSEVEIYDSLLAGDLMRIGQGTQEDMARLGLQVLPQLIKRWNFTTEDGREIAINNESIAMLPLADMQFLLEQVSDFAKQNKKKVEA